MRRLVLALSLCLPAAAAAQAQDGCFKRDFYEAGPASAAAKSMAAGSKAEVLFHVATGAPAASTGWTLAAFRRRYPRAKLQAVSSVFADFVRLIEFSENGKALFAVNFSRDGTPGEAIQPDEAEEVEPAAIAIAIETSNPRFRTQSGVRPGMPVAEAARRLGPGVVFQEYGISGADSRREYLHFGRSSPELLLFSRYRFVADLGGSENIAWKEQAGPKGDCSIYWSRDFKPRAAIKVVVIDPPWP